MSPSVQEHGRAPSGMQLKGAVLRSCLASSTLAMGRGPRSQAGWGAHTVSQRVVCCLVGGFKQVNLRCWAC